MKPLEGTTAHYIIFPFPRKSADLALNEMGHLYQLGRARRSKHEALQEERDAKEKAGGR